MYALHLNARKWDLDWPLLLATAGLSVIGVCFIFSATADATQGEALFKQTFFLQIVWLTAGLGAATALCLADYSSVARWARVFYWGAMASLLGVLVIGALVQGARRWINFGVVGVQPSEFAKIAFIILMADFLSRPAEELRKGKVFFTALGYTALPFLLILVEPDLGSALVFGSVSLAMMFAAGVPNRFLRRLAWTVGPVVAVMVAVILLSPGQDSTGAKHPSSNWFYDVLLWSPEREKPASAGEAATGSKFALVKSYQKDRLLSFFGIGKPSNQSKQALISVGSGGLWGTGWRQGTQHELGFLPKKEAHNDFIFSVIAEETGFVGSVVILTLYAMLLFSGIKAASQARDRLGLLLAVGVVTLLFSHVFINIGMNIHLMPVTGIPLPLLSYGGSSVVCSLIAIGILHNVHIYRKSY